MANALVTFVLLAGTTLSTQGLPTVLDDVVNVGRPGYLFSMPRELTINSTETFCLTLRNTPSTGLNFSFFLQKGLANTSEPLLQIHRRYTHVGRRCVSFEVPTIRGRRVIVRVRGTAVDGSGYAFEETRRVELKRDFSVTFVETDKPVYKAGDTVRFRMMTVDDSLRPVRGPIGQVWIETPSGVRMEQWTGLVREHSFVSVEAKLSQEPVLGRWKIKARVDGNLIEKTFKVAEYVPPKFEVSIEGPGYLLLIDESISGRVCAQYTYGQPVPGKVFIKAYMRRYKRAPNLHPKEMNGTLGPDGCFQYGFSSSELKSIRSWYGFEGFLFAEVEERGTGIKINSTFGPTPLVQVPYEIKIKDLRSGYKPYITDQKIRIGVKSVDGKPAVGESIQVNFTLPYSERVYNRNGTLNDPVLHSSVHSTDDFGRIEIPLPRKVSSRSRVLLETKALTVRGQPFPLPDYGVGSVPYRRYFCRPPTSNREFKSWFSPSDSFLKIEETDEELPCGQERNVTVRFTDGAAVTRKTLYYTVISKGKILAERSVVVDRDSAVKDSADDLNVTCWKTSFALDVATIFAPRFKLLVHYVRDNGEVVADEAKLTTQACMEHSVTVGFDAARKLPGEATRIELRARPDSLCGFSIVDKSVDLMGDDYKLKKADVFRWLERKEIPENPHGFSQQEREYCENQFAQQEAATPEPSTTTPSITPFPIRRFPSHRYYHYSSEYSDSITAFRGVGLLTLTDMRLETRPCKRSEDYPMYFMRGGEVDMVAFDAVGGRGPMPEMMMRKKSGSNNRRGPTPGSRTTTTSAARGGGAAMKKEKIQEAEIRNYFPETWLWNLEHVPREGVVVMQKKAPHTITEWKARAVCASADKGLGLSEPTSLLVFQPFFVSAALPYSVIREEKVPLKITVFNYLDECLAIRLRLIKYRSTMRVVGPTDKKLCICGRNSTTSTFVVVPQKLDKINITVSAEALTDGAGVCAPDEVLAEEAKGVRDVLIKPLLVEPEGIEVESTYGRFVCLNPEEEDSFVDRVKLDFKATDYVDESARLKVTAIGDVLGPALDGLDDLLKLPTGCGEQNMLKFAPNIFILEYLEATNQDNQEIKQKAIEFMKVGYQRELTYRHDDGSYSAFGNRDSSGSLWLTAFVVKCFGQARKFIDIDQEDLDKSIGWLRRSQNTSGEFPSIGRVIHKSMKGGLEKQGSGVPLTAYTIGALLEGGISPDDEAIVKGMEYLMRSNLTEADAYSLVLIANTLSLMEQKDNQSPATPQARPQGFTLTDVLSALDARKKSSGGSVHWSNSDDVDAPSTSSDIEMTAYALMTYTQIENIDRCISIVRWLTEQRNSKGGFRSTQDTVVGLQSLAGISKQLIGKTGSLTVKWDGYNGANEFRLNPENRLLLHRAFREFPTDPDMQVLNVQVSAETEGCAMIQASLKYNVREQIKEQKDLGDKSFKVRHMVSQLRDKPDHCKWRKMETCVTYSGSSNSGMVMVEVKMVSGWIPDKSSLKEATKANSEIRRFDVDSRKVSFYLDNLTPQNEFCFAYSVEQVITIGDPKQGLIKVFDYYEPTIAVDTKYNIKQTCGTKEEIPFNQPPEEPGRPDFSQRRLED